MIWMTVIALAPEFGVALAAKHVVDTDGNYEDLTRFSAQKYTMPHAFYVQMGGIIIYETSAESSIIGEDSARNLRSSNGVSIVAHRGSEVLQLSQGSGSNRHGAPKMTRSLIEVQPDMFRILESEIKDLSKADVITKAFAITQCTWLIVQCISQVAHGGLRINIVEMTDITDPAITSRPYIDYLPSASLYIASTTFLAIHLAAWNWEFPSTVVRSLWRWINLSTLVTSFTPLILFFQLLGPRRDTLNKLYEGTLFAILLIAGATYIISRFAVLGLTFYCLSSMPENAYATLDWLVWVPHFS
ncbi:hypothetical protein FOFC_08800 [Fusarium oxysporum]|nr:hypothetical protein FOFC_08800 [Fusarium oxysporum]